MNKKRISIILVLFHGLFLTLALIISFGFSTAIAAPSAILTVTNTNDSGAGSLRQAIAAASPGDTIEFAAGLAGQTIFLSSELGIAKNLTIGSSVPIAISGSTNTRVFNISAGIVTLDSLTITNGFVQTNDCATFSQRCGGGIMIQSGTTAVTINNSTIVGNIATGSGASGGGIYNFSAVLTINNSTISGNTATEYGGGIYNRQGTVTLNNSTVSGNQAFNTGGGLRNFNGNLHLYNTILANSSGGDCSSNNGPPATNLNSLIQSSGCGTSTSPDPGLGALADNSGSTFTHALLPGSPAIDNGDNATCLAADQRGIARPKNTTCDIGAFESRGFSLTFSSGTSQTTGINTAFPAPLALTVSSVFSEPVQGGTVTFSGPASGAGLSIVTALSPIGSGGVVSYTATANHLAGAYQVLADSAWNTGTPAAFDLTNYAAPPPVRPPSAAASILQIVDNTSSDVGLGASMVLNGSGNPVISYIDKLNLTLKLAVCSDAVCSSATRSTVDSSADLGTNNINTTSLALNGSGNPVIAYAAGGGLKVAVCNNATCTSSPTLTTIIALVNANANALPSLVLNSSDFPFISYTDTVGGGFGVKLAVCSNTTCASTPAPTTIDSGSVSQFYYSSLVLNNSGLPVISYFHGDSLNLKVAVCNDVSCTVRTTNTLDNGVSVGAHNSIKLDSDGFPVVSYFDSTNLDLKLAVCSDTNCTISPTLTIVDGVGSTGRYTSLALDSSDLPVISYSGSSILKVAVCNDKTCSNPNLTSVNTGDSVNYSTSLALNSEGLPVISYYDATNDDLKLAVCNICLVPAVTTVDSLGAVGNFTSLALDESDSPVIAYRDFTNDKLKIAFCDDAECSSPELLSFGQNVTNALGIYNSLALDSSGYPVISTWASGDGLSLGRCHTPDCVSLQSLSLDISLQGPPDGQYSSLALNSSGFPVVSFFDDLTDDLKIVVCNDIRCEGGDETVNVVDGIIDSIGRQTSLALNSSGFPVISYINNTNIDLKLAVCNDASCSGPATIRTIDSNGVEPSIAINSSGFPVISYYQNIFMDEALKVAVCNDATCTSPTITVVDSNGITGRHTSLVLTSDDYPVISYWDNSNKDLKVAICNDIACTSPTLVRVDSPGDVGKYSSLAITSSGYPVISYYDDFPIFDLKVAYLGPVAKTPNAVLDLAIQKSGSDAVLSWTAVLSNTDNSPAAISAYHVYRDTDIDIQTTIPLTSTTSLSYTDPGAAGTPGHYFYTLIVENSDARTSSQSNLVGVFTFELVLAGTASNTTAAAHIITARNSPPGSKDFVWEVMETTSPMEKTI